MLGSFILSSIVDHQYHPPFNIHILTVCGFGVLQSPVVSMNHTHFAPHMHIRILIFKA